MFYNLASCPAMVESPQNITVLPGKTVKFTCKAYGLSSFIYVWENSYGNLSSNSRKINIKPKLEFIAVAGRRVEISELTIRNIDVSDEGLYYCTATNDCGNDTTSVWLEVNSKIHIECILHICSYIFNKYITGPM